MGNRRTIGTKFTLEIVEDKVGDFKVKIKGVVRDGTPICMSGGVWCKTVDEAIDHAVRVLKVFQRDGVSNGI